MSDGDQLEKPRRTVIRAMASGSEDGLNESIFHPVWRKLPVELVEVVLKCVPFESLVRFHAVCKRFNSLITSPKFARICQRQQASKPVPVLVPLLILRSSCSVKVFNTKTNSWLTCHLPIFRNDLYPLELTAASEGLVCFETVPGFRILDFRTFVIYNLLTRAFKCLELPILDERDIHAERAFTSLVVNLQAGTFTLVVVTASKTLLYDSADGSWRSGAPLPDIPFDRAPSFDTVTLNGTIYVCRNGYRFSKVLKYDVRSDRWSEILVANEILRANVRCVEWKGLEILEHRGKVVLVSTRKRHQRLNNEWHIYHKRIFYIVREALMADRMVFQALDENEWTDMREIVATVGVGDVICVTMQNPSKDYDSRMRVLYFNCSTQKPSLTVDL